jgi:GT2 family glycosyltransferase
VSAKQTISLSIAVVCYNSPATELHRLIDSLLSAIFRLRKNYDCASIPIYLIDNSETAPLARQPLIAQDALLKAANVEIKPLHGHGNIGYGSAHNLVLAGLASDYHLLLNSDIEFDEESLCQGLSFLLHNPEVALVSPSAENDSGVKQYLCKRYPAVLTLLVRGLFPAPLKRLFHRRLARYEMHELPEDRASFPISIVSGCCMLCRSASLKQIGGFDEGYFLYFEDFDLSMRMAADHALAYLPAMRIKHAGGQAASKGINHIRMFIKSALRFFKNHGWRFFSQQPPGN